MRQRVGMRRVGHAMEAPRHDRAVGHEAETHAAFLPALGDTGARHSSAAAERAKKMRVATPAAAACVCSLPITVHVADRELRAGRAGGVGRP